MRLSKRMRENLLYMFKFGESTNGSTTVRLGRPIHHGNQVTHDALLRRGLIQEANDEFRTTTLTDEGRRVARQLAG
jgi:hypothetical protein